MRSPHIYSNCVSPQRNFVSNRGGGLADQQQQHYHLSKQKDYNNSINNNMNNEDTETLSTHSETNSFISNVSSSSFTTSATTTSFTSTRKSLIPQPRASLSSFAVPTWNNSVGGEHCSNIRVVARIRPSIPNTTTSTSTTTSNETKKVVFAIDNNQDDLINQNNNVIESSSLLSPTRMIMKSPTHNKRLFSSSLCENNNNIVADIAARFNTTPSSPIAPGLLHGVIGVPSSSTTTTTSESNTTTAASSLPTIITTPTKFIKSYKKDGSTTFHSPPPPSSSSTSSHRDKTPLHTNTNGGSKSGLISSSTLRQSFIPKPGCTTTTNTTTNIVSATGTSSSPLVKKHESPVTHQIAIGTDDPKYFDFDAVFDTTTSQQDVYDKSVGDAIRRNIFRGFNTTVLSYGQMNSGKTYSMYGGSGSTKEHQNYPGGISMNDDENGNDENHHNEDHFVQENDGIAFRAIHDLFMAKQRHATGGEVVINATVIELYNDRIIDLLGYKKSSKLTSSSSLGSISSKGLTSIALKSPSHARQVIQSAFKRKKKTRSHTVCTLQVTINPAVNRNVTNGKLSSITSVDVVSAKLTLVDLVGSEANSNKTGRTTTPQQRRSESAVINKDLFVLSQCITALAEKSKDGRKSVHVPFRDSKLTTLLRGSLGGNCCTVMIACVSPEESDLEDSLNTLRYAERTRNITNRVKKNMIKTTALTPAEGAALRRENKVLKSQLLDMTRKYQFLRRGKRGGTSNQGMEDDESTFDVQDIFSPTNSNVVDMSAVTAQSEKKSEAQMWRMKFEKLVKICEGAGLSTSGAELDEKDEAMLVSHQVEILELKELLQRFVNGNMNDGASVASGFSFQTFDFPDDHSTVSGTSSLISSVASRSLKSELLNADYIGRTRMMETEDRKLTARIEEKKIELEDLEKKKILQSSAMKLKLEKAESLHEQTISKLKEAEEDLNSSIKSLERKKVKLEEKVNEIEEQLRKKEEMHAQEIKDHEENLNQIDLILAGLKKQMASIEEDKKALESEVEELGTKKSSIVHEREEQKERVQTDLDKLKSQVRALHEEKLALFNEVEDLQNASRLVVEYSQEQLERQQCEEKLVVVEKEVQLLRAERGALQKEVAAFQSVNKKQIENQKKLEKEVSSLKDKVCSFENSNSVSVLQERTNEMMNDRPPLPSPKHGKRSLSPSPSMRSMESSFMSTISISNVPDHFHFPETEDDHSSVLFGDGNESMNQDQKSIHSCYSENSSLNSEQIKVRMQAERLLFWADRSISRNRRTNDNGSMHDFDKENVNQDMNIQRDQNTTKKNGHRPNLPLIRGQNKCTKCTCHLSLFSGKAEHTEFFLPKLGMACKCCSNENLDTQSKNTDPKDLKSFLRSWQVNFLKSIGVRTAEGLVQGEKRYANDMAKAMKQWRHKKRMKPARTKSCLVALQIWSKVAKSVVQSSVEKKKMQSRHKANKRSSRRKSFEFAFEHEFESDPMFMEVGVRAKSDDDDCSFASVSTLGNNMSMNCMDDSLSLMEGEYEI